MKKLIMTIAIAAVAGMLATPVMAASEWKFGASLRYETFWNQVDYGKAGGSDLQGGGTGLNKNGKLAWGTRSNSRVKMNVKSDHLEGYVEMGWDTDNSSVTTREFWGKYKFNDLFSITIGQAAQLFNTGGLSNQVWGGDMALHGLGTSWRLATPKITLSYGNFSFALAQPYSGTHRGTTASVGGGLGTYDRDIFLPAFQASYQYKTDTWRAKLAGAYLWQRLNDVTGLSGKDENIHSWLMSLDGNINFGPLFLAGAVSAGQNWADAEWNTKSSIASDYTNGKPLSTFGVQIRNNKLKSTTSIMTAVIAGYRLTEALRFEAGASYRYDDNNAFKTKSNIMVFYLQAAYTVAPGFSITPEIGYIDLGKAVGSKASNTKGADLGYTWYAGAKWQMDF